MDRKMKLDLDALAVETFHTDRAPGASGTVHGHDSGPDEVALIPTTDWHTCRTCPFTCLGSQQPDTCGDLCSSPCVTIHVTDVGIA
jgi:rubrerythrin